MYMQPTPWHTRVILGRRPRPKCGGNGVRNVCDVYKRNVVKCVNEHVKQDRNIK
jgi:hypothetical protein